MATPAFVTVYTIFGRTFDFAAGVLAAVIYPTTRVTQRLVQPAVNAGAPYALAALYVGGNTVSAMLYEVVEQPVRQGILWAWGLLRAGHDTRATAPVPMPLAGSRRPSA